MWNPFLKPLLPAMLLTIAAPLAAQEAAPDPCPAGAVCRVIAPLRVEAPDGRVQTIETGMTLPFVIDSNVVLTPGETVVVMLTKAADEAGGEAGGELAVTLARTGEAAREGELATGEVRFDFGLIERGNITLVVTSNYAEPLEYGALKVSLSTGPERTSVCALMPGVAVYEMWQEPIYQMALWGFRPDSGLGCAVIDFGGPDQLQQTGGESGA